MIIWERGCCSEEGKNEEPSIEALKNLLVFLLPLKCFVLEIRSNFRVEILVLTFHRDQKSKQLASFWWC